MSVTEIGRHAYRSADNPGNRCAVCGLGKRNPVHRLHLRSWTDAEGWNWSDMCGCELDEDHDIAWPEHLMTWPVAPGPDGEWETDSAPCSCHIGRDHDRAWDDDGT